MVCLVNGNKQVGACQITDSGKITAIITYLYKLGGLCIRYTIIYIMYMNNYIFAC